jgi:hypothetical protein
MILRDLRNPLRQDAGGELLLSIDEEWRSRLAEGIEQAARRSDLDIEDADRDSQEDRRRSADLLPSVSGAILFIDRYLPRLPWSNHRPISAYRGPHA